MSKKKNMSSELHAYKKRSMWQEMWRNYKKNPSAMVGLVVIIIMKFAAGAWVTLLCIVLLVWLMTAIKKHYDAVAKDQIFKTLTGPALSGAGSVRSSSAWQGCSVLARWVR